MKFLDITEKGVTFKIQQFPVSLREYSSLGDRVGPKKFRTHLIQGIAVPKRVKLKKGK